VDFKNISANRTEYFLFYYKENTDGVFLFYNKNYFIPKKYTYSKKTLPLYCNSIQIIHFNQKNHAKNQQTQFSSLLAADDGVYGIGL
jgi:hypothetical protein